MWFICKSFWYISCIWIIYGIAFISHSSYSPWFIVDCEFKNVGVVVTKYYKTKFHCKVVFCKIVSRLNSNKHQLDKNYLGYTNTIQIQIFTFLKFSIILRIIVLENLYFLYIYLIWIYVVEYICQIMYFVYLDLS